MISIINYDNKFTTEVSCILDDLGLDYKLLTDEVLICKSETIILPDCSDIKKALRKMQLMNISNVLKILNKKIIGINNGMFLMCSNFIGQEFSGMGLFHSDVYSYSNSIECEISKDDIVKTKNNASELNELSPLYKYKSSNYILSNENTCLNTTIENKKISLLDIQKNYFGINLDLCCKSGKNLLQNVLGV